MTRDILDDFPELKRQLQAMMPRSPRYRFYRDVESGDRYFYTTEKINHKGHSRYVAGIYRHLKTKRQMKLVKRAGFAKRYKAKEWALAAYQKKA